MNLTVIEQQIKATDQDMSAQITQFKAEGVNAIVLTVSPTQTASAAGVAAAQGLDVPILGSNPVFAPGLLAGPTADALQEHLYVASPISTFDQHPEQLAAYEEAYPDATPSIGVVFGFGMAETMKQVLDTACENGDLTRAGVREAFDSLEEIDTGDLIVPLRGFETGKSPSLSSFILRAGRTSPVAPRSSAEAFEGEFAEKIAG